MLSTIAVFGAIAAVNAGDLPFNLTGKVQAITGLASMACSNKYINNTEEAFTIDDVLCDTKLVPAQFQQYIPGLQFGANSTICGGYACAIRFLGCVDATYRVEAKIIANTGKVESCAERVGLDVATCVKIGKFITVSQLTAKKRDVDEVEAVAPVTTGEPDMHFVKLMVRAYYPELVAANNNLGLAADETLENYLASRKRDTVDELLKQAQLCNPLISTGIDLLVAQVPALSIIKGKFGPCGQFCELAMCGLNLMCHTITRSALLNLDAQREGMGCNKTTCSKWVSPVNVCAKAPQCNNAQGLFEPGTLDLNSCLPPKTIYSAGQVDVNDCCDRCDDKCSQVVCQSRQPADCGVPSWPLCKPFVVERENPFACCPTCINVCQTTSSKFAAQQPATCAAPPPSCPEGKVIGPTSPGSCCLGCVDVCSGVPCPSPVTQADCTAKGLKYVLKDRAALAKAASPQCSDCCPQCVSMDGSVVAIKTEKPSSASSIVLSVAALAAMLALMF